MNRYADIKQIKNTNPNVGTLGTKYYVNVTYPEITPSASDIWVETEFGDRLDLLANQFYQDVTLYWIIACANPNKVNMGSLYLTEGTQLRIPTEIVSIVDSYNLINQ